uniref:hypothetical protein n=1 Tax=uncultured Altererythrobacter sp. TaxID=500840 RepID=UPI00261E13B5|nr:hypothetical protein [uncultured Altererythrobacter sp.]
MAALALVLAGCSAPDTQSDTADPQDAFWGALSSHCGNTYAGEIVSEDERDVDWQGRDMVAHWAECSEGQIAIAFHMASDDYPEGFDRSRTWVVTRTDVGLRLKHDHRHDDGSEDAVTQYGGDTAGEGSSIAQDFPVDEYSITLFEDQGLDASLTNVWRLEVTAADSEDPYFVYQLTRRNDPTRLFRVRFDASTPIEPPPPAWGWQ